MSIRDRRKAAGLNIVELGRLSGLGTTRVAQIERAPEGKPDTTGSCFWDGVDENGNRISGFDPARTFPGHPPATEEELAAIEAALTRAEVEK